MLHQLVFLNCQPFAIAKHGSILVGHKAGKLPSLPTTLCICHSVDLVVPVFGHENETIKIYIRHHTLIIRVPLSVYVTN